MEKCIFRGDFSLEIEIKTKKKHMTDLRKLGCLIASGKKIPNELVASCHKLLCTIFTPCIQNLVEDHLDFAVPGAFYVKLSAGDCMKLTKNKSNMLKTQLNFIPLNQLDQPLMIRRAKEMNIKKEYLICTPIPQYKSQRDNFDIFKVMPLKFNPKFNDICYCKNCDVNLNVDLGNNVFHCVRCSMSFCSKHSQNHKCYGICGNPQCDVYNNLKVCGTCKKVRYCSINCQKIDWQDHKKEFH